MAVAAAHASTVAEASASACLTFRFLENLTKPCTGTPRVKKMQLIHPDRPPEVKHIPLSYVRATPSIRGATTEKRAPGGKSRPRHDSMANPESLIAVSVSRLG